MLWNVAEGNLITHLTLTCAVNMEEQRERDSGTGQPKWINVILMKANRVVLCGQALLCPRSFFMTKEQYNYLGTNIATNAFQAQQFPVTENLGLLFNNINTPS